MALHDNDKVLKPSYAITSATWLIVLQIIDWSVAFYRVLNLLNLLKSIK